MMYFGERETEKQMVFRERTKSGWPNEREKMNS